MFWLTSTSCIDVPPITKLLPSTSCPYPSVVLEDQRPSQQRSLVFSFGAWVNSAKSDEDGLHQTGNSQATEQERCLFPAHFWWCSLLQGFEWAFFGTLKRPLSSLFWLSSCIHHPFLVPVIQVLPKCNYGVGFLISQAEGCVTPELHQIFCQPVHMLISWDILVVNSLFKNTSTKYTFFSITLV